MNYDLTALGTPRDVRRHLILRLCARGLALGAMTALLATAPRPTPTRTLEALETDAATSASDSTPARETTPERNDETTPGEGETTSAAAVAALTTADGLLALGRSEVALALLDQLDPASRHDTAILRLRAWALLAAHRYPEVAALTHAAPSLGIEGTLLALLAASARDRARGRAGLYILWWEDPDTRFGLAALRALAQGNAASYAPSERAAILSLIPVTSARTYLEDDEQIATLVTALSSRARRGGALFAELEHARGVYELRHERFAAAATHLATSHAVCRDAQLRPFIELRLAEAYRRDGRYNDARRLLSALAQHGDERFRARARAAAGQMALERQAYDEASALFRAELFDNPVGEARARALWGLGFVAWRTAAFAEARRFFLSLLRETPSGEHAAAARYWAARSLEEQGERTAARAEFTDLALRHAIDYYGYRARGALRGREPVDAPPCASSSYLESDAPVELGHLRALVAAHAERRARALLARLLSTPERLGPRALATLATVATELSDTRAAERVHELTCARFPARPEQCPELGHRYPIAWIESLQRTSERERVPLAPLLAVIATASAFDAKRTGPHGELGLLQLPRVALRGLWRENRGRREPTLDELMTVDRSGQLSTRYFARLLRSFNGRLEYALAALHAGPGTVTRWLSARGELPADIFVEEIPYPKTAAFVRQVLADLATYEFVYGETARPSRLARL